MREDKYVMTPSLADDVVLRGCRRQHVGRTFPRCDAPPNSWGLSYRSPAATSCKFLHEKPWDRSTPLPFPPGA